MLKACFSGRGKVMGRPDVDGVAAGNDGHRNAGWPQPEKVPAGPDAQPGRARRRAACSVGQRGSRIYAAGI